MAALAGFPSGKLHAYVTVPDAVAQLGITAVGLIETLVQIGVIAFMEITGGFFTSTVFVVVVLPQEFVVVNFIVYDPASVKLYEAFAAV